MQIKQFITIITKQFAREHARKVAFTTVTL